jgi:DinB family protein
VRANSFDQATTLTAWTSIPRKIRRAIEGLSARDLKARGGSEGWSIREYVHHLVEANLVASTIVLAALGKPGCRFDWSWMIPDERWMSRLGYDRAPLEPAIELLEALCVHVADLARGTPESRRPYVRLESSTGSRPRRKTLRQVLYEECEHAQHHLRDIAATRKAHGRPRKKARSR